jgi:predicted AlkP superfamily pyrophosphatase or phosphodiesterase
LGNDQKGFPYTLSGFINKDYGKISSTPHGNTLTAAMAEAAILSENLGRNGATDLLAVSFSSPDYIGHAFGPDSWEQLDDFARLDETLGNFFSFLDKQVGKGNYTVFLSADHGVAHIPDFSIENKLPGAGFSETRLLIEMYAGLKEKFIQEKIVLSIMNDQVVLIKQ